MSKMPVFIIIGVLIVLAVGGVLMLSRKDRSKMRDLPHEQTEAQYDNNTQLAKQNSQSTKQSDVQWQQREDGWQATGTPPQCPDPLNLKPPADLSLVTAILYPGQTRGGNYKPHGGLRFDNQKDSNITVTAPMAAQVVRGSRYLVGGEMQYTFDFINSCGIMYRLGHLLKLTPEFQQIADKFPPASEGDSRTERVEPPVSVQAGDTIATAVGTTKGTTNVFFDWGVYDLRQKNKAAQDASWASQHDPELAPHALCWLELLSPEDSARVKSLPPGDPTSGKNSDYCK